jgi:transcriptional regulator with XRE-family HTH domain
MGNKAGKPKHKPLPLQLKAARDRLGMSQERLGELTGMTGVTIGRIEKGKQNWTQEFLQEAAAALNIHWADLLPPDPNSILALWALVPESERERAKSAMLIFAAEKTRAA